MTDERLPSVPLKEKKLDKQTQTMKSTLAGMDNGGTGDQNHKVPTERQTSGGKSDPVTSVRQVLNQQLKKKLAENTGLDIETKMTPTALSPTELTQNTATQCMALINQGALSVLQPPPSVVPLYSSGVMVTKSAATEAAKAFAGGTLGSQGLDTQLGSSNQAAVLSPPMSVTLSLASAGNTTSVDQCIIEPSQLANVLALEGTNRVFTLPFSVSGSVVQPSPTASFISTTANGQGNPSVVAVETRKPSTVPSLRYEAISSVPGVKKTGNESTKVCEKNATRMSSVSQGNAMYNLDGYYKNAANECQTLRQSQPVVQVIASDGSSSLIPMTVTQTGLPELANRKEGLSATRSHPNALEAPRAPPIKTYITLESGSNGTKKKTLHQSVGSSSSSSQDQILTSTSTSPSGDEREEEPESGEKIKRPMNAFMIWSREQRAILARQNPGMTNADISVRLGNMWNDLDYDVKQGFFDEANRLKLQHRKDHPGMFM